MNLPTAPAQPSMETLRQQFITSAGNMTQTLGFGRIVGQIYAHAYFQREPQSLDDLTAVLGISKGSASMAVRQLESWGALKRVWVKGDRKDYYETTDEFGRIIRKALIDMVGQQMEAADNLLDQADETLAAQPAEKDDADAAFFRERMKKLRWFRHRAQGLWDSPVIRLLLK